MADSTAPRPRPQLAHGVRDYLERERQRILSSCTSCGKCYEACPMTEYIEDKGGANPEGMAGGVLGLLRDGTVSAPSLGWISVCIRSGSCVPACPENVNPKLMMRMAKMIATGGMGGEKTIKVKDDRDYYARIRAFAQLQLSDEELKEWME